MPHQRAHVQPISTALCIHGSAMRTKTPAPPDLIFANFYYSAKCLVPDQDTVAVALAPEPTHYGATHYTEQFGLAAACGMTP